MTPQEQQASHVMHRELGVKCAPITGIKYAKKDLGFGVSVETLGPSLSLVDESGGSVVVSQEQIHQLEMFLIAIGWRCS